MKFDFLQDYKIERTVAFSLCFAMLGIGTLTFTLAIFSILGFHI